MRIKWLLKEERDKTLEKNMDCGVNHDPYHASET